MRADLGIKRARFADLIVHILWKQPWLMVGAGLLAKADLHSTSISTDTASSRASPLPQLEFCQAWHSGNHR
ncbi:hypothetical protein PMI36_05098 [Pseudomonas sp. GM79]|nr:hypothetical protein PMI36_05098 [Pseudomonas sp. GM79]